MKIRPASPAHQAKHGYDYMLAVDRTEWVALKVAVEIMKEDLEAVMRKGHAMSENQLGILALYTQIHMTMEENTRACPDLPIQDEAVCAPGGRGPARFPTIQEWARRRLSVRPPDGKD